jgi:hypothetical protein
LTFIVIFVLLACLLFFFARLEEMQVLYEGEKLHRVLYEILRGPLSSP